MTVNYLFSVYAIIFLVLFSVLYFQWFQKKMVLYLIALPIAFVCLYVMFAILYMIADIIFGKSDSLVVHILTNIPNFCVLYQIIKTIKEK